jgi:uncharacterized membrane protein YoaK (UPF0700 family)
MSVALHTPNTIYSARHMPSWMLLAFAAGSVNAGALLACQRYVTHVTGTATRIGVDAGTPPLLIDYVIVLVCFLVGAMTSVLALQGRRARGKEPLWALPLVIVAGVLLVAAVIGATGAFGPFGSTVETAGDFFLLSILSFAMGLQNATVATSTGLAIRTTHMTGPTSDLGVHLATAFFEQGEARRAALRGAALRAGKLASFILGGAAMIPLAARMQYLSFVVPAVVVLVAAGLSFVPSWSPSDIGRREPERARA